MPNFIKILLAIVIISVLGFFGATYFIEKSFEKNNKAAFQKWEKETFLPDNYQGTIKNAEEKMINLVSDLPLVKKHAKYLEKATNGKRHQIILVYSNSKENNGDYWIKVGEDNGTCFVSTYNFFVNPKNVKIKYLDVVSDSLIDVKDIKE